MAQFADGFPSTTFPACDKPMFSYQWQQNYLSRAEFALAIQEAERRIADQLHYWTYPHYAYNELQNYPHPANAQIWGGGANTRKQWKSTRLNYSKIISPGLFTRTLIDAAIAITRVDTDGDGVFETFTATVTGLPTGTTADQVALYINAADRVGNDISDGEQWRIRPIYVTVTGTTATIRGHSCLLVKPTLYEGYDNTGLTVTLATNYLDTLGAYRVWIDPATQGIATWEAINCCNESGVTQWPITITNRQAERGFVGIDWSQADCSTNYDPDLVYVNYLSGVPLVNGFVQQELGKAVAMYATALLPSLPCGCDRAQLIITHWREPIYSSQANEQPAYAPADTGTNTFGVERGAVYAWRAIQEWKQVWGALL